MPYIPNQTKLSTAERAEAYRKDLVANGVSEPAATKIMFDWLSRVPEPMVPIDPTRALVRLSDDDIELLNAGLTEVFTRQPWTRDRITTFLDRHHVSGFGIEAAGESSDEEDD